MIHRSIAHVVTGVSLVLFLIGCAGIPGPVSGGDSGQGGRILSQSAVAQNGAMGGLHDVNVRFEGHWLSLVTHIQPVLVDSAFRGQSEERYLVNEATVGQAHTGPGGAKQVMRTRDGVRVWYNGRESGDPEAKAAAAMVADVYRMCLFGPAFVQQRNAPLGPEPGETVDGLPCDNVLAILRPGLGISSQDRVLISIDRTQHLVRRLRMTLDGLESTRGAVVDISPRNYIRLAGAWWPTSFLEELKRPFPAPVHRWRLTAIDFNREITPAMLDHPQFDGAAAPPAGEAEHPSHEQSESRGK